MGIFEGELMGKNVSCTNADPRMDFGGPSTPWRGHCDPNLEYAKELMATMSIDDEGRAIEPAGRLVPSFGVGTDGDGDRNMILGSKFFVSPSDSVAIIVANAHLIPQFSQGLKGCARSSATSSALDIVAKEKGLFFEEVPTGWKYFGNLMDSPEYTPFICGEESFGTGADHLREKDGMWAVLAWLQILAGKTEEAGTLMSVEEVVTAHWNEYGRNYYVNYTFEDLDVDAVDQMMEALKDEEGKLVGKEYGGMTMMTNDYKHKGLRFLFDDNTRIIIRKSGTATTCSTVRVYLDKYIGPDGDLTQHPFDVVKPLADVAEQLCNFKAATGRDIHLPTTKT